MLDWVIQVGPGNFDQVNSVLLLEDGAVAVAGLFEGLARMGTGSRDTIGPAYGLSDGFVGVLEPDGTQRWSHWFGGASSDGFDGLTAGRDGQVVVAASFIGAPRLDRTQEIDPGGSLDSYDAALLAFDTAHGSVTAAQFLLGDSSQRGASAAIDEAGNRYLAGFFVSETLTLGPFQRPHAPPNPPYEGLSNDAFVASWDPAGNPRWLTTLGGIGRDEATWLRFDHGQLLVGFDAVLPDPTVHSAAGDRVLPTAGLWAFATTLDPDTGEVSDPVFSALDVRGLWAEPGHLFGYTYAPGTWTRPDGVRLEVGPGLEGQTVAFFGATRPDGTIDSLHPVSSNGAGYVDGGGASSNRVALAMYTGGVMTFGAGGSRVARFDQPNGPRDGFFATFTLDGEFRCAWGLVGAMAEDVFDAAIDDEGNLVVVGAFEDAAQLVDGQGNVLHTFTDPGDARPDGFIARFRPAP